MGEIIVRKVRGMNWMAKISLVLIFTLCFSVFMYQGWYKPKKSEAAITTLQAWSNIYTGTARPTAAITYNVPAGTVGNTRMLVVAVHSVINTASAAQTCTVTYGGQAMNITASNFATSSRVHTALFYLQDTTTPGLGGASSNQLQVNLSAQGTQMIAQVDAAVFEGVIQDNTVISSNQSWLNNGTVTTLIGPFAAALAVGTGDLAVEAVGVDRLTSATARTITTGWAANWSSAFGPTNQVNGTNSTNFYIAQNTTAGNTTSQHVASGTTNGTMSGMSFKMLPMNLQVGNGIVLGTANAGRDTFYNVLDSFTMAPSAGGVSVNTLTLTGTNFSATNLANVEVYRDADADGAFDATDVLVPSTYTIGSATSITITFTSAEVVSAATNYLITVNIGASATLAQTITGRVTAATGNIGTPTYNDLNSATLTIVAAPGLTIGDTTNPANGVGGIGADNNPVDGFTLQTVNAANGNAIVNGITVTGTANFTAANIADVHVYEDNGTLGTFDGADLLVPATATPISGNATTLTFTSPIVVSGTAKSYLIVLDITSGATPMTVLAAPTRVTAATGNGIATPSYNDTTSAALTFKYPSQITSCRQCHAYPPTDSTGATPARNNPVGSVVGDHQKHNYVCSTCHVAPATEGANDFNHRDGNIQMQASIAGGTYARGTSFAQTNSSTSTATCSNISCHGGNNPTPQWGIGTAGCTACHSGTITRTKGVPGGTLDPITGASGEFGLAWGHKKLGRATVADADCIVCHLEGNYATQKTSSYHADGNIDLRDPDVQGETPITNISGGAFTFKKFSMSFTAGSRSTALSDASIADVISQKFCLKCHDGDGALNTTARSNNGGTGTAAMPFGGIALGANYTATNGAIGTQGLINVAGQFATTNSSWHPVMGPKNRDFPTAAMLADPYKPTGTRGTSGTLSQGVVLNCFDCHNVSGASPFTDRTVAAHGNAETIRGVATVTGTPSAANGATFCGVCHTGHYGKAANNHGTGSAFSTNTNGTMTAYVNYGCNICHGSRYTTAVVRPVRAQDIHGSNVVPAGTQTKSGRWAAATKNGPIAFIRNNYDFNDHAPLNITGTVYTPACMGGGSAETTACQRGVENYTVGGTY